MRLLVVALLVVVAGCASAPKPVPTTPSGEVTLGAWCDRVSSGMCDALAGQCFGGNRDVAGGCVDSARSGCVSGRDPSMASGRTVGQLDQCLSQLRGLSCEGLGAGLGSGALSVCSAQAHP
jgi:hypothetical protein